MIAPIQPTINIILNITASTMPTVVPKPKINTIDRPIEAARIKIAESNNNLIAIPPFYHYYYILSKLSSRLDLHRFYKLFSFPTKKRSFPPRTA